MFLAPTLTILIGLSQAGVNQQDIQGESNPGSRATLPELVGLKRFVDRVELHFIWIWVEFKRWQIKRIVRQNQEDIRKIEEMLHPRQIDFPKLPDYMLERLPPGHRRV